MVSSWASGVPPEASAFNARWWQFETWLRSLAYVELRAKYGRAWQKQLPSKAVSYAKNEAKLAYMPSSDGGLILSYLDVFDLFDLIDSHWEIFELSLIDQQVWLGRIKELRQIRHRNAHCRRPHADDLARIEQTLRDLESGTFKAVAAFNRRGWPDGDLDDPLVEKWVRRSHGTAQRLIDHAASNYGVDFELNFSHRTWAPDYQDGEPISGQAGYLWHALFVLHNDGIDLKYLWNDTALRRPAIRERLVYLCADSPYALDVSFSAMDDPSAIADAIGNLFDAIVMGTRMAPAEFKFRDENANEIWMRQGRGH